MSTKNTPATRHPATRHIVSINDLTDREIETVFDVARGNIFVVRLAGNVSGPVGAFAEEARHRVIGDELRLAGTEISRRLGWIEDAKPSTKRALVEAGE